MKKIIFIVLTVLFFNQFMQAQNAFTQGNLVIFRAGDGSENYVLSNTQAVPVFLDEYGFDANDNLVLVQSINLPTSTNGSNKPCTTTASSVNGGHMSLSADGQYIAVPGFAAVPNSWPIANEASSPDHNRMVALVNYNGQVNTTTALENAYSKGYIRSAATKDGSGFWLAADNNASYNDGFLRYAPFGSSTSIQLAANTRRVFFAFENELYVSSDISVFKVGDNFPTTAAQTTLNGLFPTISGSSFYGFCIINLDEQGTQKVMYVTNANGSSIKKFSLVNGTWESNGDYTLSTVQNVTPRSIQAKAVNGTARLYVVCSNATAATAAGGVGALYEVRDAGTYNEDFTVTETPVKQLDWAGTNKVMKSLVWAPSQQTSTSVNQTTAEMFYTYVENNGLCVKSSKEETLTVFNTLGTIVFSGAVLSGETTQISGLTKGQIYFVKVGNQVKKVIL